MTAADPATSTVLSQWPDPRTAVVTGAGGPAGIGSGKYTHYSSRMKATPGPIGGQTCQLDAKHGAIQPASVCLVPRDPCRHAPRPATEDDDAKREEAPVFFAERSR